MTLNFDPVVSAPNLVKLREPTIFKTRLFLAAYTPPAIWTARVAADAALDARAITISGAVTVETPFPNATVLFGTTPGGREKGVGRFTSISGSTLNVGRGHNVTPANGDYLTVLKEIKPQGIECLTTDADVVLEDGNIAYIAGANTHYPPLALFGCPAVARLDPVSGEVVVPYHSSSVPIAPAATLTDFLFTFPGGSPGTSTSPGSAGSPINVTYDTAGQSYPSLLVTDSNDKQHIGYRPTFIFDPADSGGVQPWEIDNISNWVEDVSVNGWSVSMQVHGQADADAFPEGALVVIWAEDYFDDVLGSIGGQYAGRENVCFVGYTREVSVFKDFDHTYVTFKAEGIGVLLGNLYGSASSFEMKTSPTAWHELAGQSPNLVLHHLLTRHSTVSQICDVNINGLNYTDRWIDTTETMLADQLNREVMEMVRTRVGSSAQGMLYVDPIPQLLPAASRTQAIVMDATFDDLRDSVDLGVEKHSKPVSQIDFTGFWESGDGQEPLYALAPAHVWGLGKVEKIDNQRLNTQDEANIMAGLYLGWRNNNYDAVSLKWRGNNRVVDVFPANKIRLSLGANQNSRGLVWVNQVLWHTRVTYNYVDGALLVDSICEADVVGPPGVIGYYPPTPVTPPFPTLPPLPPLPPVVPPGTLPPGTPPPVIPPIPGGGGIGGGLALASYDFLDGRYGTVAALTELQYFPSVRHYNWGLIVLGSTGDLTFTVYVDGVTRILGARSSGAWTISIYDASATLLETDTPGSADVVVVVLTNPVDVPGSGHVVRITVEPVGSMSDFVYGLGGAA